MEDRVAALEAEVALLRSVAGLTVSKQPSRSAVETFIAARAESPATSAPEETGSLLDQPAKPTTATPVAPTTSPPLPPPSVQPPSPAPASNWNFESLIGTRGLPILGALAVVIGVAMFLVYAAQQGWLAGIPNWARLCGGIAFGMALVGAGEWLRRRINPWAAVGLFSAGIGCAYLSIYAGFAFFSPPVLSNVAAFALLALVSIAGIGLALRANLAAVAVLSMLFALLAPILIGSREPSLWVMPIYLVVLLATGMWMNVYIGRAFIWPGRVAWWGTAILGTFWALSISHKGMLATTITLAFVAIVWGIVQAALVQIARRDPSRPGQLGALSSFGIASWSTAIGVIALDAVNVPRFLAPAGAGAGAATLAMVVLGSFRPMSEKPRTFGDTLCISYWAQAAALLIITVLLLTEGNNPVGVIIWMVMGVAAIWAGRRIALTSFTLYGIILLAIGSVRLVGYDSWASGVFASPIAAAPGLMLSTWTALCAVVAAAWLAAAGLLRTTEPLPAETPWPTARPLPCTLVGTAFLLASIAHSDTTAQAAGWVALLVAITLGSLSLFARGIWLHAASAAAIITATVLWLSAYLSVQGQLRPEFTRDQGALPLLYPGFILSMTIGAIGLAWAWLLPRVRHLQSPALHRAAFILAVTASGVLLWAGSSLEVARVTRSFVSGTTSQSAAVSIWWAILAVGLIVAGFMRVIPALRHVGLGLLGLAAGKVVIYDMANVSTPWRIASFMILGLLMLAVAAGYAWVAKRTAGRPS